MIRGRGAAVHHRYRVGRVLGSLIGCLFWSMLFSSCDVASTTVSITAEEFRFSPHTFELPAHQLVRLIVRNRGRERHVFQSRILTHKTVRLFESASRGQWGGGDAIPLEPGEQVELSIELSPGLYPFRCWIRGHAGMEGMLIVQDRK